MTEYIDITAYKTDKEFKDVAKEWEKLREDPESDKIDVDLLHRFYSEPVKVHFGEVEEGDPEPDWFWHALITREQWLQRIEDERSVMDFELSPIEMKKPKPNKLGEYRPRHMFGGGQNAHLPREKQPVIVVEEVRSLDVEKE